MHYVAARAARILIIINECGEKSDLSQYIKVFRGIKLLEKYDFLLRYPNYLKEIIEEVNPNVDTNSMLISDIDQPNLKKNFRAWTVGMEKWKYGPFDRECYNAFGYLEMRGLIRVISSDPRKDFYLTPEGEEAYVKGFLGSPIHAQYIERARLIKKHLGHLVASRLTDLLYQKYPDKIGKAQLGEIIE
jgi:hypothetical protein